ncbi:MAG: nuclear transport factor 2 family protein [Terriglobia bacterium]
MLRLPSPLGLPPGKRVSIMVMQHRPEAEEEKVLAANLAFYEAMRSLDMARMEAVWLQEDWVRCLHPGWELLLGWEEVQRSWAAIFQSTGQMLISISRPLVQIVGDTAWVSCLEDVTVTQADGFSSALIETTNIFVRHRGRWLLVHRHTTPLPGKTNSPHDQILQ